MQISSDGKKLFNDKAEISIKDVIENSVWLEVFIEASTG
jgi:hypothetical protein